MITRSRHRKQVSLSSSSNGSITPTTDSPPAGSASPDPMTDGDATRHSSRKKAQSKPPTGASTTRRRITRVPIATWNIIVRKWEIPRKTLHVSIGLQLFNLADVGRRFCDTVFVCSWIPTTGYSAVARIHIYSCIFRRRDKISMARF